MGTAGIANDRGRAPRQRVIMAKYRITEKQASLLNLDWFEASTELAQQVLVNDMRRAIGKRQRKREPVMAEKARAVAA